MHAGCIQVLGNTYRLLGLEGKSLEFSGCVEVKGKGMMDMFLWTTPPFPPQDTRPKPVAVAMEHSGNGSGSGVKQPQKASMVAHTEAACRLPGLHSHSDQPQGMQQPEAGYWAKLRQSDTQVSMEQVGNNHSCCWPPHHATLAPPPTPTERLLRLLGQSS